MRGATQFCHFSVPAAYDFNPRAPCGARLSARDIPACKENFNPRAPCGARPACAYFSRPKPVNFNPRAPCGARRITSSYISCIVMISIHAPHAGRDYPEYNILYLYTISIHAPHAGRDQPYNIHYTPNFRFQSTRPMRGATHSALR